MRAKIVVTGNLLLTSAAVLLAPMAHASSGYTVLANIPTGSSAVGVAVSPTGPNAGDAYVANYGSDTVSVLDPSGAVVQTITVGSGPSAVAISPVGATAGDVYVANDGSDSVSVIDPSGSVITTITFPAGTEPNFLTVSPVGPNAGDVYVNNWAHGAGDTVTRCQ